ncbi:MAG: hypothetical protein JWN99_2778 [Ilumatobacteraceae bacterium]|nr:hypothetical protein [Ilumatobacteraceae bacterium]
MVTAAQRHEVVEIGTSAVAPVANVVQNAVMEGHPATGHCARRIHGSHGTPLWRSGNALSATDIARHAVAAQHNRNDVRDASEPSQRFDGEIEVAVDLDARVLVQSLPQGRVIDDDDELGLTGSAGPANARHEPKQGERREMAVLASSSGQVSGSGSVSSVLTISASFLVRPAPLSGSNSPYRQHMPESGSFHVRSVVARR